MKDLSALTLAALAASLLATFPETTRALNVRECQALEQRYLQIKQAASSVERNSLLFAAATHDCETLAKTLLEDGASLEARDGLGNMPLAKAAKNGHASLVKLFLEHKAPVNARNLEASTALFIAAEEERRAVAETLLAAGADPNISGRSGISAIGAAAYTGNADLVKLILEHGADPRALDATGKSAMIYAAGRGFTPVVRLLLDHGVDINAAAGHQLTALMWAAGHSEEAGAADVKETIEFLAAKGARLDDTDDRGKTALMIAAELGHTTAVETLHKAGANVTLKDKAGKSAADLTSLDAIRTELTSTR